MSYAMPTVCLMLRPRYALCYAHSMPHAMPTVCLMLCPNMPFPTVCLMLCPQCALCRQYALCYTQKCLMLCPQYALCFPPLPLPFPRFHICTVTRTPLALSRIILTVYLWTEETEAVTKYSDAPERPLTLTCRKKGDSINIYIYIYRLRLKNKGKEIKI